MRISPNYPRLRAIAFGCWVLGAWCVIYGTRLITYHPAPSILIASIEVMGLLALAIGVAFWQLSQDRHAGIIFDTKGLLLNLGDSAAFIAWDNIERVGVCQHRSNLLTLGSRQQLGIALRDVRPYIQSYEQRLPATRGLMARGLHLLQRVLRPYQHLDDRPLAAALAANRAHTGYDVLIPDALLGGRVEAFVDLVEVYQLQPGVRSPLAGCV